METNINENEKNIGPNNIFDDDKENYENESLNSADPNKVIKTKYEFLLE